MTAAYTIRALHGRDAATWLRVRLRALRDHPTAFLASEEEDGALGIEVIAARLSLGHDRSFVLGAFHGDTLVGMVGVGRSTALKSRHSATLWGMYVTPEHRRMGLARRLLTAAISAAQSMDGVERLSLEVDVLNEAARALYRSLGFSSWGVERDAFRADGRPVDEEHMVLRL